MLSLEKSSDDSLVDSKLSEWNKLTISNFMKMTWDWEYRMHEKFGNITDVNHPEFGKYMGINTPFDKADPEELKEVTTCCHSTAGMIREFFAGDVKWENSLPEVKDGVELKAPAIISLLFIHDDGPQHELVILKGSLLLQSFYDVYYLRKWKCDWKVIVRNFHNLEVLTKYLVPEPKGIIKVDKLVWTVPVKG